jgi:sucrose phosphorylase
MKKISHSNIRPVRISGPKRVVYDDRPDYSRPLLEIPEKARQSMLLRLTRLYGEATAQKYLPELERVMKVFHAHKPPELVQYDLGYDPGARFSEKDMVLITYGDLLHAEERSPLAGLAEFLDAPGLRRVFNTIHILPFFPYSSDRGFAVIDFTAVDPNLGSWHDIEDIGRHYQLLFDGVLNHASSFSSEFQHFLNGNPRYRDYAIAFSSPDELPREQRALIRRPRTSDILTEFQSINGPVWVWTTFSPDQIDLNYKNPEVLIEAIVTLLLYVRRSADIIRLDAVTYMWQELGTTCASLEETHEIIKLFREVLNVVAPRTVLLTETNVPHAENISYFGNGYNEAQIVYNFALPPLVLHTFYTGDSSALSSWAKTLEYPSEQTTYLNILDTHDGVGVLGVKGILSAKEIDAIISEAEARGALISFRTAEDGTDQPYEINTTWFGALNHEDGGESLDFQVKRFVASRSIPLVLKGIPGVYFHGLIGTGNDPAVVERTGSKRDINRCTVEEADLLRELTDPDSRLSLLRERLMKVLRARVRQKSFHPRGEQVIVKTPPGVFAVLRIAPDGSERLLALVSVANKVQKVQIDLLELACEQKVWTDVISKTSFVTRNGKLAVTMQPYDVLWIRPYDP